MSEVLDAAVLDDLIENIGVEGGRAIVELFIKECRELVTIMVSANADTARRASHSLKSSAGQLGAMALAEAARAVEQAAEAGSADLPARIATLIDCAAQAETAFVERLMS